LQDEWKFVRIEHQRDAAPQPDAADSHDLVSDIDQSISIQ
jgi:hypothetical protein